MALKLNITNNKGITTTYHRIDEVTVRKSANDKYMLTARMKSYTTEDVRRKAGSLFADESTHNIVCLREEIETKPVIGICYDKLKHRKEFAGAEDC